MFFFIRIHWNDSVVNLLSINKSSYSELSILAKPTGFVILNLYEHFGAFKVKFNWVSSSRSIGLKEIPSLVYSIPAREIRFKLSQVAVPLNKGPIFSPVSVLIYWVHILDFCNLERIFKVLVWQYQVYHKVRYSCHFFGKLIVFYFLCSLDKRSNCHHWSMFEDSAVFPVTKEVMPCCSIICNFVQIGSVTKRKPYGVNKCFLMTSTIIAICSSVATSDSTTMQNCLRSTRRQCSDQRKACRPLLPNKYRNRLCNGL